MPVYKSGSSLLRFAVGGILAVATSPMSWQLPADYYTPAYVAPTVVHPRPDSETNSWARCRLAPSEIEWSIPVVVQGGSWPYECVITNGPTGMAVGAHWGDARYMELYWTNPVAGTHNIQLRVRTQDYGRTAGSADPTGEVIIEFTLEVVSRTDVTKFVYMSEFTGSDSNNGSFGSPWETLAAFEAASTNGKQLFVLDGTYPTSVLTSSPQLDFSSRARVVVGYPGDSPVIDMDGTSGKYFYLNGPDSYVQNIHYDGGNSAASDYWHMHVFGSRVTMFGCISSNLYNDGSTGSASNHGGIWPSAVAAGSFTPNEYLAVVNNIFTGYTQIQNGGATHWFSITYGAFEGNQINDMSLGGSAEGFRTKGHCRNVTIRNNRSNNANFASGAVLSHYQGQDGGAGAGDDPDNNEICYNYIVGLNSRDSRVVNYGANTYTSWTGYVYRNTFLGGCAWLSHSVPCTIHVTNNVLLTFTGTVNDSYTGGGETAALTIVNTDNVIRTYANAATTIDTSDDGKLLDSYLIANGLSRGTRGHEVFS